MRETGSAPTHLSLGSRGGQEGRSVYHFSTLYDFILQLLNTGTVLKALWLFWVLNTPYWYEASLDQVSETMTDMLLFCCICVGTAKDLFSQFVSQHLVFTGDPVHIMSLICLLRWVVLTLTMCSSVTPAKWQLCIPEQRCKLEIPAQGLTTRHSATVWWINSWECSEMFFLLLVNAWHVSAMPQAG